jgi:hypothetical protein
MGTGSYWRMLLTPFWQPSQQLADLTFKDWPHCYKLEQVLQESLCSQGHLGGQTTENMSLAKETPHSRLQWILESVTCMRIPFSVFTPRELCLFPGTNN